MSASNGTVIHTQELSKAYKGVRALDGLSLQVPRKWTNPSLFRSESKGTWIIPGPNGSKAW